MSSLRRGVLVALVACLALVATVPPSSRAQETVLAAQAEALILTLDIGGAGLTLPAGIARATIAGDDAQASANLVDYALVATLIGVLLGEGTVFPAPVKATSEGPAEASRSTTLPSFGALPDLAFGPAASGVSIEEAHVGDGPSAGSRTDIVPVRVADAGRVSGAASTTEVSPDVALARTTAAEIVLPGAVILRGVEWWAEARAGVAPAAGFRVGALVVNGEPVEGGPEGFDAAALNEALKDFGVHVDPPVVTLDGPAAAVSPLVIRYGNSPVAAGTIGPLYTALSPAVIELFNAIQTQSPEAGYLLFVTNIALATAAGIGEFTVKLGGASASLERRVFVDETPAAPVDVTPVMPPPAFVPPLALPPLPTVVGDVAAPPVRPAFPIAPAATRRLDDHVPDAVVVALGLGALLGAILFVLGRRRREATEAFAA